MKDHPASNSVTGHHILYGSPVSIKSKFTPEEIAAQRAEHLAIPGEAQREQLGVLLQKLPILGRFLAHLTGTFADLRSEIHSALLIQRAYLRISLICSLLLGKPAHTVSVSPPRIES